MAQGFNITASDKYSKSYEEALQLVSKMSGGKLSVVRDLFNRIVFSYLIGNDDMHLKNISLIRKEDNRTFYYDGLTPNYDQLFASSFDISSVIGFLALDLLEEEKHAEYTECYQKYGFYTAYDFTLLGKRAGLPQAAVQSVFKHYFSIEKEMQTMIERSFMPDIMKKRAVVILLDRFKALKIRA